MKMAELAAQQLRRVSCGTQTEATSSCRNAHILPMRRWSAHECPRHDTALFMILPGVGPRLQDSRCVGRNDGKHRLVHMRLRAAGRLRRLGSCTACQLTQRSTACSCCANDTVQQRITRYCDHTKPAHLRHDLCLLRKHACDHVCLVDCDERETAQTCCNATLLHWVCWWVSLLYVHASIDFVVPLPWIEPRYRATWSSQEDLAVDGRLISSRALLSASERRLVPRISSCNTVRAARSMMAAACTWPAPVSEGVVRNTPPVLTVTMQATEEQSRRE